MLSFTLIAALIRQLVTRITLLRSNTGLTVKEHWRIRLTSSIGLAQTESQMCNAMFFTQISLDGSALKYAALAEDATVDDGSRWALYYPTFNSASVSLLFLENKQREAFA